MSVCHLLVICDDALMPLVCLPDQDEALTAAMTLGVPGWAHTPPEASNHVAVGEKLYCNSEVHMRYRSTTSPLAGGHGNPFTTGSSMPAGV